MDDCYENIYANIIRLKNRYRRRKISEPQIAVVDDSNLITKLLKESLIMIGLDEDRIQSFESGQDLIDSEDFNRFDAVITDIMMPGINGYEMSIKMREADYDGLIIAITGVPDCKNYPKAFRSGINYFLTKPFEIVDIEKLLKREQIC